MVDTETKIRQARGDQVSQLALHHMYCVWCALFNIQGKSGQKNIHSQGCEPLPQAVKLFSHCATVNGGAHYVPLKEIFQEFYHQRTTVGVARYVLVRVQDTIEIAKEKLSLCNQVWILMMGCCTTKPLDAVQWRIDNSPCTPYYTTYTWFNNSPSVTLYALGVVYMSVACLWLAGRCVCDTNTFSADYCMLRQLGRNVH